MPVLASTRIVPAEPTDWAFTVAPPATAVDGAAPVPGAVVAGTGAVAAGAVVAPEPGQAAEPTTAAANVTSRGARRNIGHTSCGRPSCGPHPPLRRGAADRFSIPARRDGPARSASAGTKVPVDVGEAPGHAAGM